jgi:hypothetical protein
LRRGGDHGIAGIANPPLQRMADAVAELLASGRRKPVTVLFLFLTKCLYAVSHSHPGSIEGRLPEMVPLGGAGVRLPAALAHNQPTQSFSITLNHA